MRLPQPLLRIAKWTILLLPALTILIVWLPEFRHYSVPEASITAEVLAAARRSPSEDVLKEIREFYLFPVENRRPELENAVAGHILEGRLEIPDVPPARFNLPFTPNDLETLPAGPRLWFAAFAVPDFLLAAYENTGREEFFVAARDFMLAWSAYERRAWLPKGLLWNDHATAARVRVLGEFWRLYRKRPDYDPAVGRAVLQQAARYGEFLLDPGQFTFSTNHGVMQNIGLLHLSLAFPSLPRSASYRQVALDRLHLQMGFFIDPEGVIREHSAGYQAFGMEMLGIAFRCLTLLEVPIPEDWSARYARGLEFFARLRRPDATLPAYGDTDGASQTVMPRATVIDAGGRAGPLAYPERWEPDQVTSLHPSAGYWVDWNSLHPWPGPNGLRQTVVTWTRRPPPAHKHADELSVLLWSDGISWLTSVGYWPYGVRGREEAESWAAGNAPHLANENLGSQRTATLVSSGRGDRIAVVDLQRTGPGAYLARRQVVRIEPDLWVILDYVRGTGTQKATTVWTLSPAVSTKPGDTADSYVLETDRPGATARLTFLGSSGMSIRQYRGSYAPFAGWHVEHYAPKPSTALVVEQPAGESWLAVVLSLTRGTRTTSRSAQAAPMAGASGPEEWSLTLPTGSGTAELRRDGSRVTISRRDSAGGFTETLRLTPGSDPAPALESIRTAFQKAASRYPRFQELAPRRVKVTYLLLFLLIGQEFFIFLVQRAMPKWALPLRAVSVLCWLVVGGWLHFFFLRSWVVLTQ